MCRSILLPVQRCFYNELRLSGFYLSVAPRLFWVHLVVSVSLSKVNTEGDDVCTN